MSPTPERPERPDGEATPASRLRAAPTVRVVVPVLERDPRTAIVCPATSYSPLSCTR